MSDSKDEIMEATYQALCRYGYAELTIEKIAEESEKAKSNIYYHFDDKEELMLAFLDFMKLKLESELEKFEGHGKERFDDILDLMLGIDDEEMWAFHKSLQDLQARAQYQEEFAEKFKSLDQMLESELLNSIEEMGLNQAETKAKLTLSIIQGSLKRRLTYGNPDELKDIKREIKKINCQQNGKIENP